MYWYFQLDENAPKEALSYITEEDNVYDRPIQEYATGLDALFESDKIKNDMFKFEHDLWSF